jgi:DNA-binding response OmpR family regulator
MLEVFWSEASIDTLDSCDQAVKEMDNGRFQHHIILVGIDMIPMSVWDFLDYMQEQRLSNPVFILSPLFSDEDEHMASLHANVKGLIVKPLTVTKVINLKQSYT